MSHPVEITLAARGQSKAPRCRLPSSRYAFSMVELLVVFVVISILAALLLPTLARSKAMSRRVACMSGLRQLGLATQMYWEDNDGYAFRYKTAFTNGGDVYWFGWIERGSEGERAYDPTQGVLYPYLRGRGVERCPALNYRSETFKLRARGATYGYGYNTNLSRNLPAPPFQITHLRRPSQMALLADAAQVNTFLPPASPERPMLEEFYYISSGEPTTHFRHRREANVLFCDGHIDAERPVAGSIDMRMPAEGVGRLRASILRP